MTRLESGNHLSADQNPAEQVDTLVLPVESRSRNSRVCERCRTLPGHHVPQKIQQQTDRRLPCTRPGNRSIVSLSDIHPVDTQCSACFSELLTWNAVPHAEKHQIIPNIPSNIQNFDLNSSDCGIFHVRIAFHPHKIIYQK